MRKTQDSPSIAAQLLPQLIRFAVPIVALSFALAASAAPSPSVQASGGWLRLFDGSSLFGWLAGGTGWSVNANTLASDPAQPGTIRTTTSFADFDLRFEARVVSQSGAAPATLLFRADPQSKPAQPGFTLSLSNGSIAGLSGIPVPVSSGWNSWQLVADGTHITASVNGRTTADGESDKNRIGWFEFSSPRGTRVEIRSVVLRPLNLDPLYNGSNLDGWMAIAAPAPQSKSKFHLPIPGLSGKPKAPPAAQWTGLGTIHGHGGIGQLESALAWDDFILQFAARVSGKDAEVFFRGTPKQFGSGYAISASPDRRDAYGPGGLVKLQKSRAPSIPPGQYFTCTVVARAHRFAVWLNGALVTDYYDSRPEGAYHSAAGPLGFRLKSEKAALDLRDVRAAALSKGPEPPSPAPVAVRVATPAPAPAAAPAPIILPGPSPQEKAQQEQIRKLTVAALSARTPEDALRINKQILVLDPGDMPAQQRLDKAQAQIDAASAQREQGIQRQQASAEKLASNAARRDQLLARAQDDLLRGHLHNARDRLNDAERLGAAGPAVDRLRSLIAARLRNRLLLRLGLGGTGLAAFSGFLLWRLRRRGTSTAAFLVALDGLDKGKRYALNQEITHIGGVATDGGKKNEVLVRDPDRLVSRFHCEVHRRGNSCYLIDLASSNGTYLHRRALEPGVAARLRDGDKFTLARAAAFELRIERRKAG